MQEKQAEALNAVRTSDKLATVNLHTAMTTNGSQQHLLTMALLITNTIQADGT